MLKFHFRQSQSKSKERTFGSVVCGTGVPGVLGWVEADWAIGSVCVYNGKYWAQLSTSCFLPFLPIRPNSPSRICWAASLISTQWCCQLRTIISTCGRLKFRGSAIETILWPTRNGKRIRPGIHKPKASILSGNRKQWWVDRRLHPCLISACCCVYFSSCSSLVHDALTLVDCRCNFFARSCSGMNVAIVIDISVLDMATIANRWFEVNVVLNSQCRRWVKSLVRFSWRTSSGGNVFSSCKSVGGFIVSTVKSFCHVGSNSDM